MTDAEVRDTVLRMLTTIAPEADVETLAPDESFRDQLDIDSMDFLNFVVALSEELGVEVPEADYGKLDTLDRCAAYLLARV